VAIRGYGERKPELLNSDSDALLSAFTNAITQRFEEPDFKSHWRV
jgi:hypothetical protein